jgi:hypothetical protein
MQANDLSLLIRNPIVVYSFLALYGVMMVLVMAYVHTKFRAAAKTLKVLEKDWQSAESAHSSILGVAKEQLSKVKAAPAAAPMARTAAIGSDLRHQVVAMAKRGIAPADIARSCSLQEGEVDVLLGMARLQR